MVIELDIAGEFIYNGIQEINRLNLFANDGPTFSALYNVSVGIERLQKIVYVLFGLDETSSYEDFEKSLITHNHTKLRDLINQLITDETYKNQTKFSDRENEFFEVLQTFYNSIRYTRYNINKKQYCEVTLLKNYLKKYVNVESEYFIDSGILVSSEIKKFLGRVIGNISKKYYNLVKFGSEKNHTFTYELRYDSKAGKVFLGTYRKNSLIDEQLNERISFKELMIYFRKTKDIHPFFKYIDTIEPLKFDPEMVVEYLQNISIGIIPQTLVDEVKTLYDENNYSIDRLKSVDLFADTGVWYEYPDIEQTSKILNNIVKSKEFTNQDIRNLEDYKQYIRDDEIVEIIDETIYLYDKYKNNALDKNELLDKIKECCKKFDEFLTNSTY